MGYFILYSIFGFKGLFTFLSAKNLQNIFILWYNQQKFKDG